MKSKKKQSDRSPAISSVESPEATARWPWFAGAAAAFVLVFWAYSPALHGPFLFDDATLPFSLPGITQPLYIWMRGIRPVLYLTYWVNAQFSGTDPNSYHVVNVLIHYIASALCFFIVRRLLEWSRFGDTGRDLVAAFAALIFLLHPVQTESVAYLAGRSESLSVMLAFCAFTAFLYRKKPAVSWVDAGIVLLLFGAAILTKEHIIALPALLLLTDYWWNPGFSLKGIRDNWKLYLPMALGALGGLAYFRDLIMTAETAGFALKDFTWYQYFFTQCRGLFVYIGVFLLPAWLRVDWDFPISRTIFDHGAIFGLLALVAIAVAAWIYRRRFPLASYGFFAYLILMAPTSSILPIRDPIAERRLYFAMIGLLLVVSEVILRLNLSRKAMVIVCAVVALIAAPVTYARARLWSDATLLWADAAQKSPNKTRVRFQLAFAYYEQGRYSEAIREFEAASKLGPPTYNMLVDWALAYDSLNQPDVALAKLRQAAQMEATGHIYSQIGMVYAKRSQWTEALDALNTAEKLEPKFAMTHVYRGKIYLKTNMAAAAVASYQRALSIDPTLVEARKELALAQQMMRSSR